MNRRSAKHIRLLIIPISVFAILVFTHSSRISHFTYRGMTISCQTWGYEWATPEMKASLLELKAMGVNSFAIHPYARITEDGHVLFRTSADPEHIVTPLKWAKQLKMQIMLKPHLAYWGTRFSWRGDIDYNSEEKWHHFFRDYKSWIVHLAEIAGRYQADILCIGLEYRHSLRYEDKWREIIQAVKKVYKGKITYAANWDTYQQVAFWDELDYIGIQAYFPLVFSGSASSESEQELRAGWRRIHSEIEQFISRHDKAAVFTELGYNTSIDAARIPWASGKSDDRAAQDMQMKCLKIALEESKNCEYLAGIFLWKWFPDTQPFEQYENFNLQRPEIKNLIKHQWSP